MTAPRPLRVSFCCADTQADPWLVALRGALPEADITLWQPGAPPADYAVVWAPPQQFFDEQTALRAVFNTGAGVDALLRLRIAPSVQIVRLDDAGMGAQMAEYVCHALLGHLREMDAYAAQQQAGQWHPRAPLDRQDFPVGILGLGVLGQQVAQAVAQFGFPLNGWSRSPRPSGTPEGQGGQGGLKSLRCFAGAAELDAFLAASRVLVCLLPLTDATRDLLDLRRLRLLRPGGVVINVARGALVVDEALLELLDSGHLASAVLDVFRTEPLPAGHPFWKHPKIALTPHISARTLLGPSVQQIAAKLRCVEAGQPVPGTVDRQRGY